MLRHGTIPQPWQAFVTSWKVGMFQRGVRSPMACTISFTFGLVAILARCFRALPLTTQYSFYITAT